MLTFCLVSWYNCHAHDNNVKIPSIRYLFGRYLPAQFFSTIKPTVTYCECCTCCKRACTLALLRVTVDLSVCTSMSQKARA